jgi:hypothetical protein
MKKLSTLVITLFLGASLALAQTGGDKSSLNPQPLPPGKSKATTTTKTKKGHKGGKKGKKGSTAAASGKKGSGGTTPPPK